MSNLKIAFQAQSSHRAFFVTKCSSGSLFVAFNAYTGGLQSSIAIKFYTLFYFVSVLPANPFFSHVVAAIGRCMP